MRKFKILYKLEPTLPIIFISVAIVATLATLATLAIIPVIIFSMENPKFAHPKTSYRNLRCYQKGVAIYDLTKLFLKDHIPTRDRTNDQMLQSARSGKANIVEGRTDAAVSLEMEIKLYGVAIGSLEELLNDYEDYLRTNNLPIWNKEHPRYENLRKMCASNNDTSFYTSLYKKLTEEEFCNLMLTLIHQNLYMIKKLYNLVKDDFLKMGGIKEQMFKARIEYRNQNKLK